jgi:hypothetical protein
MPGSNSDSESDCECSKQEKCCNSAKRGPRGFQGVQGLNGPQGIQGPIGPQGVQGVDGPPGPSFPENGFGSNGGPILLTSNNSINYPWGSVILNGGITYSFDQFVVPTTGTYTVSGGIRYNILGGGNWSVTDRFRTAILKNGTIMYLLSEDGNSTNAEPVHQAVSGSFPMNAGDNVSMSVVYITGAGSSVSVSGLNFAVVRIN